MNILFHAPEPPIPPELPPDDKPFEPITIDPIYRRPYISPENPPSNEEPPSEDLPPPLDPPSMPGRLPVGDPKTISENIHRLEFPS